MSLSLTPSLFFGSVEEEEEEEASRGREHGAVASRTGEEEEYDDGHDDDDHGLSVASSSLLSLPATDDASSYWNDSTTEGFPLRSAPAPAPAGGGGGGGGGGGVGNSSRSIGETESSSLFYHDANSMSGSGGFFVMTSSDLESMRMRQRRGDDAEEEEEEEDFGGNDGEEDDGSSSSSYGRRTIVSSVPTEDISTIASENLLLDGLSSSYEIWAVPRHQWEATATATPIDQQSISTTETEYHPIDDEEGEDGHHPPISGSMVSSSSLSTSLDRSADGFPRVANLRHPHHHHHQHQQEEEDVSSLGDSSLATDSVVSRDEFSREMSSDGPQNHPDGDRDRVRAGHDSAAFENVGSRLALQSIPEDRPPPPQEQQKKDWYERFTEQDWLKFRDEATMVLNALRDPASSSSSSTPSPPNYPKLALPPSPPPYKLPTGDLGEYRASESLPFSFVCPLCDDVAIGATALSCGCSRSTVCTACWESYSIQEHNDEKGQEEEEKKEKEGGGTSSSPSPSPGGEASYTVLSQRKVCPACGEHVENAMPCHALDVAILHCAKALPEGAPVQISYYMRLQQWRKEVARRFAEARDFSRDEERILASLIQNEEEWLWKENKDRSVGRENRINNKRVPFWRSPTAALVFLGEVALVIVAAAVVSSSKRR